MLSLSRWAKGGPSAAPKRRGRPAGSGKGKRGRPAGVRVATQAVLSKRTKKTILKGLKRMGHGSEMLAQAFSHLT
jgi:hypothetical protein